MKKIPLALTLLSTLLFSQYSLATDTSHTTQNPTYELDGKSVLGRTENVYLSSVHRVVGDNNRYVNPIGSKIK